MDVGQRDWAIDGRILDLGEDRYETEKEEESEILVAYDSILTAYKQNLINMQSPFINTFYHKGSVVIIAMCNLTVNVFEHLDITYPMDVNKKDSLHTAHPQRSCN